MTRLFRRMTTLLLVAALLPVPAYAQTEADKSQAREIALQAERAFQQKDWKTAEDLFKRADALYHVPTLTLGVARAQAQLGKFVESWEAYNRIVVDGPPPNANAGMLKAVDDAKAEIGKVAPRRARVTITVAGADTPKVTIDGTAVPAAGLGVERFVNPGQHTIHASADGYKDAEQAVTLAEGGEAKVPLSLVKGSGAPAAVPTPVPGGPATGTSTPEAPAATSPASADVKASGGSGTKTLAFVALGVGGVGVVVGAVTGIMAMGKHSDLANACPSGVCSSAQQSDLDSYHTLGVISTIGFIVGGVGIAAGAVLYLTAPKHPAASAAWISPYVGPGTLGAMGRF
jgi:hypothetical protein